MENNGSFVENIADASCSRWSGGCTYELAIGPEGTSYGARDFEWRVSSASVELEESVFTDLPDYERWILTLDGDLELVHDGGAPVRLSPFTPHRFDGASHTRSAGRVRDFNLMLRKGVCRGGLRVFTLRKGERIVPALPAGAAGARRHLLLFCADGSCIAESGEGEGVCRRGDYVSTDRDIAVRNGGSDRAIVVMACIYY